MKSKARTRKFAKKIGKKKTEALKKTILLQNFNVSEKREKEFFFSSYFKYMLSLCKN